MAGRPLFSPTPTQTSTLTLGLVHAWGLAICLETLVLLAEVKSPKSLAKRYTDGVLVIVHTVTAVQNFDLDFAVPLEYTSQGEDNTRQE